MNRRFAMQTSPRPCTHKVLPSALPLLKYVQYSPMRFATNDVFAGVTSFMSARPSDHMFQPPLSLDRFFGSERKKLTFVQPLNRFTQAMPVHSAGKLRPAAPRTRIDGIKRVRNAANSAKPLTVCGETPRLPRHSEENGWGFEQKGPGQELPRPAGPAPQLAGVVS